MDNDIRLVCFDLGGILVRLRGSWLHCCKMAGVATSDIFAGYGELPLPDSALAFDTGKITELEFAQAVSVMFPQYTPDQVFAVLDVWLDGLYTGAGALIDMIHTAGLATACLSNTNERHWREMPGGGRYGDLDRLRYRFASCHFGERKPDENAFRHVERSLKLLPHQIVYFDDRAENVEASKHRGWKSFLIDPVGETVPRMHARLREAGVL